MHNSVINLFRIYRFLIIFLIIFIFPRLLCKNTIGREMSYFNYNLTILYFSIFGYPLAFFFIVIVYIYLVFTKFFSVVAHYKFKCSWVVTKVFKIKFVYFPSNF